MNPAPDSAGKILVVDDEPQITRMLRAALQSSGYQVDIANNGRQALENFAAEKPALLITDLAMPLMNGLELTQAIRRTAETPIIVLSVRDGEAMKVRALDAGADDYLTKPFSVPELLARVRAQLRRVPAAAPKEARIQIGDFAIDPPAHTIAVRGQVVRLTPKEFDLLLQFAREPHRVLTHQALLRSIWGPAGKDQPENLRVLVAALRKKIEPDPAQPRYIQSEPWVGYRFRPSMNET